MFEVFTLSIDLASDFIHFTSYTKHSNWVYKKVEFET